MIKEVEGTVALKYILKYMLHSFVCVCICMYLLYANLWREDWTNRGGIYNDWYFIRYLVVYMLFIFSQIRILKWLLVLHKSSRKKLAIGISTLVIFVILVVSFSLLNLLTYADLKLASTAYYAWHTLYLVVKPATLNLLLGFKFVFCIYLFLLTSLHIYMKRKKLDILWGDEIDAKYILKGQSYTSIIAVGIIVVVSLFGVYQYKSFLYSQGVHIKGKNEMNVYFVGNSGKGEVQFVKGDISECDDYVMYHDESKLKSETFCREKIVKNNIYVKTKNNGMLKDGDVVVLEYALADTANKVSIGEAGMIYKKLKKIGLSINIDNARQTFTFKGWKNTAVNYSDITDEQKSKIDIKVREYIASLEDVGYGLNKDKNLEIKEVDTIRYKQRYIQEQVPRNGKEYSTNSNVILQNGTRLYKSDTILGSYAPILIYYYEIETNSENYYYIGFYIELTKKGLEEIEKEDFRYTVQYNFNNKKYLSTDELKYAILNEKDQYLYSDRIGPILKEF